MDKEKKSNKKLNYDEIKENHHRVNKVKPFVHK